MASSTIAPYKNNTTTQSFTLVSTGANGSRFMVTGRDIGLPYVIEMQRKLTAPGAATNDHVVVRVARTEKNATTGKLATCQCLLDVSIPKDTSMIGQAEQKELLAVLASVLNDYAAMAATTAARSAIIEGRDL